MHTFWLDAITCICINVSNDFSFKVDLILMYFAAQVKSVNLTLSSGRFYKSAGTRTFLIFHFPIFAISTPKITMSKCKKHVFQFINSTLPSSENNVYNWLLHFPMFAIFTKPTMTRSKFCRKGYVFNWPIVARRSCWKSPWIEGFLAFSMELPKKCWKLIKWSFLCHSFFMKWWFSGNIRSPVWIVG